MSSVPPIPLLEIKNVEICYSGTPVISELSLSVRKGEILSIVGESGSGKSTLINAVMGLLGSDGHVSKGKIFFKGKNLLSLSPEARRRTRGPEMGMVFQNHASSLCPIRTIGAQYYEAVRAHRKINRNEVEDMAAAIFEGMNLKDASRILASYPFELSGGMSQRVGIAMAMLLEPDLLLTDEPTSALDVIVKAMVSNELKTLRNEKETSIVMVTHDIGLAAIFSDNIAVLNKGRLVEYGATSSIINDPQDDYTRELIRAVPRIFKR
ncbi:ABC-type dipeptide/oligopeptide/nickel transport system, ATPase component [Desulfofustis glycolicus DSM 9705]|uniref:ABC-type dipeptide/oligopeptide/nickel transport system, ATPase component n=2 Tax=Desulfofustis glycolicus TaxID=51195 RepID=A0A1M5X0N5_9BACT|nr:ABC-type dipeptide/oligopeptide/nickel transport system, ATPase component [Desulfofustis glycolicus DSM 9705]